MANLVPMAYIERMRVLWPTICGCMAVLLAGLPAAASVAPLAKPEANAAGRVVAAEASGYALSVRESLRRDVEEHPGEFVVFVTEAGAYRFMTERSGEVERETNRQVLSRGVMGYWQGKTLVVLPWTANLW
jgi:hypothetical protein